MKSCFSKAIGLSLLWSIANVTPVIADTSEDGVDYTSPYINPQRDCLTEGMINPEGKSYRYLFSRDCRVVHVLPPAVLPQNIRSEGVNLQACTGVNATRNTMNNIDLTIDQLSQRIRDLETRLDTAKPSEVKSIEARIASLQARISGYNKAKEEAKARFDRDFVKLPGAVFSIVLDGDVSQNEILHLRALNAANLQRRRTIIREYIDDKGQKQTRTEEVLDLSTLRPAQIQNSYFSFIYNVPDDAGVNAGIIKTDIPNLQYLEQPTSRSGVIHVKGNGGVSGKVIMSVTAACDYVKPDPVTKKPVFDDNVDPFFTVNRTFGVQQLFGQGYVATLKVKKVIDQITTHTITHTNEGFKKSSVFLPTIKADVSEIMDFQWTSQFDNGKNIDMTKVFELKNAVAAKMVDDYIDKLVQAKILTIKDDSKVDPVNGGHVDEVRQGHRCWTEKDGGISGWLGRRHQVCGDFTYTVKVWRDGITEDEIRRHLGLIAEEKDGMQVHTTAPFYFTTAFSNSEK